MDRSSLITVLVVAAAFAIAARRWRAPYIQSGVRIVVGVLLIEFSRQVASWRGMLIMALGLVWIGLGASDIWKQRSRRRTEEN